LRYGGTIMAVLKNIAQRLFGRTVIDSLDLNQNAWYIDEEQVTMSAAQLNSIATLTPTSVTVDIANDDVLFLDHSGSHVVGYDSFQDLMTAAAGTSITATAGVLTVSEKGVTALKLGNDVASTGLTGGDGAGIALSDSGSLAVGSLFFNAVANCTAVVIGGKTFTVGGGAGEWAVGGSALDSATNLAACINAETTYFAHVDTEGDTVLVFTKTVGLPVLATIARTGGAEPSVLESLAGGAAVASTRQVLLAHTVTVNEAETTAHVMVPLPFAPSAWTVQVRSATGLIKDGVTDLFTLGTLPNRIICTEAGAGTHVVATDVITVYAQE
jgi:hypothetical protein